ncbi:sensor histidine kinase [Streptomyces sp. NPDC051018]|uniref:sensor histidine kinase n=1 Tax=Streptomyces sp. NPDC051018 TaxID=3365639 RepID=UPI00378BAE3C
MSADLPLEEPGRRLSSPARARERHVWEGDYRSWDWYFAIIWAATLAFTLGSSGPGAPVRAAAAGLFVLLLPWYAVVGRPVLSGRVTDERRSLVYVAGAVLLLLPPAILIGEMRIATFALVPQCFMLLPMRPALVAVALVNVVPVAAWAVLRRPGAEELFFPALSTVIALAFSAVFGHWIIRIIEQSRERAELIAELEASREEVARLSAAHGALSERERMSREIHDTLAQGFTSLLMLVQAVQSELDRDPPAARRHLGMMAETARQNLAEARALVAGGAPADLDGSSLPDALRRLTARHGSPAALEVTGRVRPLEPALEVVALRASQEALANAARHAGPRAAVSIVLSYTDTRLLLSVTDTGCGFDQSVPRPGYGLSGLRSRAAEVGGSAEVRTAPGAGTTVSVTLPLPQPSERSRP